MLRKSSIFYLYLLSITVLMLGNLFLSKQSNHYKSLYFNLSEDIKEQTSIDLQLEELKRAILLKLKDDNIKISDDLIVVDTIGEPIKFLNLITHKRMLFYRYSHLSCASCVDEELQRMNRFANKIGYDKIIVLTTYSSIGELNMYKRVNSGINFKIYNIS